MRGKTDSLLLSQITRGPEHYNDGIILELGGAGRGTHVSRLSVHDAHIKTQRATAG